MERNLYEGRINQELYHNKIINYSSLSQNLGGSLQSNFSLNHKILSSIEEIPPPLQFTPYISLLSQKRNLSNNNLTDIESSILFKRDTILYLDNEATSCDKEIIGEERLHEEKKREVIAFIIETKSNIDTSKFREEILLNCGDAVYLVNEDSINYERSTDCILGCEENEKDNEIFQLDRNIDKSLIISIRKCFNCSSPYHSYYNCQLPLDDKLIKENKEKFNNEQDNKPSNSNGQQFNSRYYIEYEKDFIFNIFLPGVISDVLKDALGILGNGNEPPYYKKMRVYGYPPGYWGDNEGDDPLKPKKDRLSKLEEKQWNSATLKIYDNNRSESDDSLEESENSEDDDPKNRKDYSEIKKNLNFTSNVKGEKVIQEKKKKVPLVYYPGLNLDFAKFENNTNMTSNKDNLNDNEANHNLYIEKQFASYPTNIEYYQNVSGWYYNGYSENLNTENGCYNYKEQPLPRTVGIYNPSWIITSDLEMQPPPPGTVTSSFKVQPPPGISTPSVKPSFEWQKDNLKISREYDQWIFQDQQMENVNHQNNIEKSNEDCIDDMDLSD